MPTVFSPAHALRSPMSNRRASWRLEVPLPTLHDDDSFVSIVRELCTSIEDAIDVPYTFDQLSTGDGATDLEPLLNYLTEECSHPFLVSALLVLRYHFNDPDDRGISQARALACELLAWRVTLSYSRQERLEALLSELTVVQRRAPVAVDQLDTDEDGEHDGTGDMQSQVSDIEYAAETTGMLSRITSRSTRVFGGEVSFIKQFAKNRMRKLKGRVSGGIDGEDDPTLPFIGLNALEIAAVAEAKKFLSQRIVQRSINAIWNGEIMFWDSVSIGAQRKAHYYNSHAKDGSRIDPYCRLRVPRYQRTFETAFLLALLVLYYVAMQEDKTSYLTPTEILLYIWIAAFAYEELGAFLDTGVRFYATDLWNLMDVGIVGVAMAYVVTRAIGLTRNDMHTVELAFDILSIMAVPLVPRTLSLVSLHPYFGTLIPSLSQMTRDLLKFLVIVLAVYLGFASTFVLLGRNEFSAGEMFWLLIYVFNSAGYLGLDVSERISKTFGPTLMVVFVSITNILLLPTLISLLTNSLTQIMGNAREEYLFQYSILVLESCTSKRLTYFLPPLNLIPLILLRPLRLVLPASEVRSARIVLLKMTHAPFVGLILAYEKLAFQRHRDPDRWRAKASGSKALGMPRRHSRSLSEGLTRPGASSRNELPANQGWQRAQEANTIEDLRQAIVKLTAQVERLEQRLGG